jgi:hypothetical protein
LQEVEALALRNAFDYVDEDHVGKLLAGDPHGTIRADVAGAYYGDLLSHFLAP